MRFLHVQINDQEKVLGLERIDDRRRGRTWIEFELFNTRLESEAWIDMDGKLLTALSIGAALPQITETSARAVAEYLATLPVTLEVTN